MSWCSTTDRISMLHPIPSPQAPQVEVAAPEPLLLPFWYINWLGLGQAITVTVSSWVQQSPYVQKQFTPVLPALGSYNLSAAFPTIFPEQIKNQNSNVMASCPPLPLSFITPTTATPYTGICFKIIFPNLVNTLFSDFQLWFSSPIEQIRH